jgi:REP element-mobilizing transposase RayT
MVRGIEGRPIFSDDDDRRELLRRIAWVFPECGTRCYAWALMPNHAHLVVRTGHRPLRHAMARILTGYAGYFNVRHARTGHLFQNRYKSVPVLDDAYLLVVIRYVHRNPLEAGLVPDCAALRRFPWTGHATLMGERRAAFQDVAFVLDRFGEPPARARARLRAWTEDDCESCAAWTPPRPSALRTDLAVLIDRVGATFGIAPKDLAGGLRRTAASEARAVVAHLACDGLGIPQEEVGRALGVTGSAVGRARDRGRRRVQEAPRLAALLRAESGSVPEVAIQVERPPS